MTMFSEVENINPVFQEVLNRYYK
ncbi:hypothetical protein DR871_016200 [Flavobacterium petrolei]|uniref:Uncharacterized protein n=1 Tax=Flavobacterium petrolei TaxID=2259594 RepID=A0A482TGU6_9FLAO|nr:DUF1810 domain-containing protein [Flavobacterium sp. XN-5]RYJ50603.1 hypothetical protein DR871_016200 [Flavobacterium petrolei]